MPFTASAVDADLPPQKLTYRLNADAPAGATIDPGSGLFTWQASQDQGGTTNSITVSVSDDGTPPLTSTRTFQVVVLPVPAVVGRFVFYNNSAWDGKGSAAN